jgi:hypothetical protein
MARAFFGLKGHLSHLTMMGYFHFFITNYFNFYQAKLIGTKVTVESFTAWKMEFDAKKMQKKSKKAQTGEKKLSGRDLFLQNSTLNESDLTFIVDDENVDFDEALFDDLDTLDLEDD